MILKVYHLTTLDNLPRIQRDGILPRQTLESEYKRFTDIADQSVESNHRAVLIPDGQTSRPVDAYARCFFNPLPPMYYNRKNQYNLCILEIHIPLETVTKTYNGRDYTFHNLRIAGARWPIILKEGITWNRFDPTTIITKNLNAVRWDDSPEAFRNNRNDTLAKRSAEILVYPKIPPEYIGQIYSDSGQPGHLPIAWLKPAAQSGHPQISSGPSHQIDETAIFDANLPF